MLNRLAILAASLAIAAPAVAENPAAPRLVPLPALPAFPPAEQPVPAAPAEFWLVPDRSGDPVVSAAADADGAARLTVPRDGAYRLIMEGGARSANVLTVTFQGAEMQAPLAECAETCDRIASARFLLRAGDAVTVQPQTTRVVITGDRLRRPNPNAPGPYILPERPPFLLLPN